MKFQMNHAAEISVVLLSNDLNPSRH